MAEQLAVVTGASSGIGYNLAKVFAEKGYDLLIVAEDAGIAEAATALGALGVTVTPVQKDLAKYDDVEAFWREVEATGRPVDAIAINAGIGVGGLFAETDLAKEINLVRVNVESTVHVAKRAVQQMVSRGSGRILITSSIAAEMVAPREAVYGASKAFDLWFAKNLQAELEDTGVTVTVLQPGPADSNFFHRADMDNTQVGQKGKEESKPYDVAKQAVEALLKGDKQLYSASLMTKIEGALLGVIPDKVTAAMHNKMAKPKE